MTIKLGIAPINWCNDDDPTLGEHITFEQCISEMAQAGFVGTEMGNKYPRDIPVLKESLTNSGLQLASAWFSSFFTEPHKYESTLSNFLDYMSFMRAMGANCINVCECGHSIQNTDFPIFGANRPQFSSAQWDSLISGLHAIGRIAHDFQMQIAYHFHAGTGVFTESEIDYLMQHTSPELISLLLDTGHASFAGMNPLSLIKKYGARIKHVHLKDIRRDVLTSVQNNDNNFMDAVRSGVFTVPGDGDINFGEIVKQLREINYRGWFIVEAEQDPAKAPPLEYAKKAYDYLSPLIN
ncbi:MAG: myo-inosose-2 dehydratase [Legionella sp.]|nr:myo-inosose-2 dehydratase [Legionella sp.]